MQNWISFKLSKEAFYQKSPSQNVDKCSKVHAVGLSKVWSHLRRLRFFVRFSKVWTAHSGSHLLILGPFKRKSNTKLYPVVHDPHSVSDLCCWHWGSVSFNMNKTFDYMILWWLGWSALKIHVTNTCIVWSNP